MKPARANMLQVQAPTPMCLQLLVFACMTLLPAVTSVRITRLSVPAMVLNGSQSSIVLDCVYELDMDHSNGSNSASGPASGLVIKWYHSGALTPIYQWIPGYAPQAFGLLRGHVNLHYVASHHGLMRHRAIQLLRPRPELSGEYTCKVTTWSGVDVATKRMTIYAPVRTMWVSSTEPRSHRVTITCGAEGVFPQPEVNLVIQTSRLSREVVRGLNVTKALVDGAYRLQISKAMDDRDLPAQCVIVCQLAIPHTTYAVSERIPHIRGSAACSSLPLRGSKYPSRSLSHTMSGTGYRISGKQHWLAAVSTVILLHILTLR